MKTVTQILVAAKALIANPVNWTQGAGARNLVGQSVPVLSDEAHSFCSLGALDKALSVRDHSPGMDEKAYSFLGKSAANVSISLFNDRHSHEEVMEMWDKAIHLAKQAEETTA